MPNGPDQRLWEYGRPQRIVDLFRQGLADVKEATDAADFRDVISSAAADGMQLHSWNIALDGRIVAVFYPASDEALARQRKNDSYLQGRRVKMANGILYYGHHKSVLDAMIVAQEEYQNYNLYMQPNGKGPIADLRDAPPNSKNSVTLYLTTGDDRAKVSYQAEIIGWWDKQELGSEERGRIDREIRRGHFNPGLFGIEEGMVNLLQLRNLVKLDCPFPVTELIKIRGGGRASPKKLMGLTYVFERRQENTSN